MVNFPSKRFICKYEHSDNIRYSAVAAISNVPRFSHRSHCCRPYATRLRDCVSEHGIIRWCIRLRNFPVTLKRCDGITRLLLRVRLKCYRKQNDIAIDLDQAFRSFSLVHSYWFSLASCPYFGNSEINWQPFLLAYFFHKHS